MRQIFKVLLCVGVLGAGCKTAQPVTSAGGAATTTEKKGTSANGNYILAVLLQAGYAAGDTNVVFSVEKVSKVEGKLKNGQNDNSGDDFTVSFANEKNEPLATYHIKHPLVEWMESSEEAGELKTVKVNKDTEHIPMRTNYRADIKKLIIRRNTRDSNTIIIPLNVN